MADRNELRTETMTALQDKMAHSCPSCGGKDFSVQPRYAHLITSDSPTSVDLHDSYRVVASLCNGCGLVSLYSARVLGV